MKRMKHIVHNLEVNLLDSNIRSSSDRLNQFLSDEFLEFGVSGNIYSKQDILRHLPSQKPCSYEILNSEIKELSSSIALHTYKLTNFSQESVSLRSSLWRKEGDDWKLLFHQGTPS